MNNRLTSAISFSSHQLGFQPIDEIARAVEELESVFSYSKSKFNPLSAVFIDLRKAFDSVTFQAIFDALKRFGVPRNFINYISFIYNNALF